MGVSTVSGWHPGDRGRTGVGRFVPVRLANGVTLDFADAAEPPPLHIAFLVGDAEFDAAFARIRDAGGASMLTLTATGVVKSTNFMAAAASILRTWMAICWN